MLWLILGLLIGVLGYWLVGWTKANDISLRWYEWLLAVIGVLLLLLAIQFYTGSMAELEPNAAWILLFMAGIPALIIGGLGVLLPWLRLRQPGQESES